MGILFEIEYENPAKQFYAGQAVVGRVIIESNKETRIRELLLRSTGKAEVFWTEHGKRSSQGEGKPGKSFSDEETYFDRRVTLLEQTGPDDIIAPPGRNEYRFSLNLPSGIPSSFESEFGNVRYYLEATIRRPKKSDHSFKSQINVHGLVDLNVLPEASAPLEAADEKQLCCFCCKSGPVGFHLKVEKSGFVPGENINFLAEVYNLSSIREAAASLRLIQTSSFQAKGSTKSVETTILEMKGPSVAAGGLEKWTNEPLQIPLLLPPTKLAGCRIIVVNYLLQVELKGSREVNLISQIPIIVGTIPLGTRSEDIFIR